MKFAITIAMTLEVSLTLGISALEWCQRSNSVDGVKACPQST
jgi:hypothetical protein